MSSVRGVCLSAFILVLSFGIAGASRSSASSDVEVNFQPQQQEFTLHQPVVLLLKVHNPLSTAISVNLGRDMREFLDLSVKTPEGKIIQGEKMPFEPEELSVGTGKAEILPGGSYIHELLLNQWFDFDLPGAYFVTISLTENIEVTGGEEISPKSQSVWITVSPRDAGRLQGVCKDLVSQIAAWQDSPNFLVQDPSPSLKLSFVDDPVAVPYLVQALYSKETSIVDADAISGLERIANKAAIEALISALPSKYDDIAVDSKSALSRLESRVTDPELQEEIHAALAPPPPLPPPKD
jgi:hypothetical protein